MKKRILIIFIIGSFKVNAQTHLLGFKAGYCQSDVKSNLVIDDKSPRHGMSLGITFDRVYNFRGSLGADLIFTQRGMVTSTDHRDSLVYYSGHSSRTQYQYEYISLPLRIGFNPGIVYGMGNSKKAGGFINVGLSPGMLLSAKTIETIKGGDGQNLTSETIHTINKVNKFDLGGFVEIGAGFELRQKYWLFLSCLYQRSLMTISNTNYFPGLKMLHVGWTYSLGLKYNLKG